MSNNKQNSRIGKVWSKTVTTNAFLKKLDEQFNSIVYSKFDNDKISDLAKKHDLTMDELLEIISL